MAVSRARFSNESELVKLPNVPYYYNSDNSSCFQAVVKSVLEYFGEKRTDKEINEITGWVIGKITWPVKFLNYLNDNDYAFRFITTFDYRNLSVKYIKEYFGKNANQMIKDSDIKGLKAENKKLVKNLNESNYKLRMPNKNDLSFGIANVNYCTLYAEEGFKPHFVVLLHADDKQVYFHDPGPHGREVHTKNMTLDIDAFMKALNYLVTLKKKLSE